MQLLRLSLSKTNPLRPVQGLDLYSDGENKVSIYDPYAMKFPLKPGKVTAIAIMALVDGILNIFFGLSLIVGVLVLGVTTFGLGCLLLPLAVYPLVLGILEIVYAAKLLPNEPKVVKPATWLAIMQICNIIVGDPISLAVGIVSLVLFNDAEVRAYFAALNNGTNQV